jgi:hypothetical protein
MKKYVVGGMAMGTEARRRQQDERNYNRIEEEVVVRLLSEQKTTEDSRMKGMRTEFTRM